MQLSKRDAGDKAAQEKWAEQRAAELAAAQLAPKDQLIRCLEVTIAQLEVNLAQRTEVGVACGAGDGRRQDKKPAPAVRPLGV